jgi:hypothetical protein
MVLPATSASYPQPPSHLDEGWLDAHRAQVPVRDCSTCHTQDDCRSCHVGIVPSFVEALPLRDQVVAPGVGLETRAPDSHASLFFLDGHAVLAAVFLGHLSETNNTPQHALSAARSTVDRQSCCAPELILGRQEKSTICFSI